MREGSATPPQDEHSEQPMALDRTIRGGLQATISRLRRWIIAGNYGTARYRLANAFLVSRLAPNPWARLKLLLLVSSMPVLERLPWRRTYHVSIRYKGLDVQWQLFDTVDAEILHEILISGCYNDVPVTDARLVLDIGSHGGISLLHFRATYPQARIIGIEPNPVTFRRLHANAATLGAEVHQLAIAPQNGPTTLFLAEQPVLSSLDTSSGGEAVTIEGRTLDSLLGELEIEEVDLLKIDVEGGEFAAFRESRRLQDIGAIIGEFHDDGDPGGRNVLFAMLEGFDIDVREDSGDRGIFVALRRGDRRRR